MKHRFINILLVLVLLSLTILPSMAPVQAAPTAEGITTPAEMEAFLDGVITAQMAENHVPGTAVTVVKDGAVFLSKGYGYADQATRTPVDPDQTLFRPGSVSKLFVWTAVMQLYEQGQLDLDADINSYLDFTIPADYPEPITLKHLMAHTPGFEEVYRNLFKLNVADLDTLDAYLKNNIPARAFPAGKVGAYSNYGAALAGYIVERVSGLPFDEYVAQNIFSPLGMDHSSFHQPLPETLAADMATGYNFIDGGYLQGGFELIEAYPAGSLSASATDMAKFMITHLQNGRYADQRILQEATATQMHEQLFTHDPRIDGMAYGFFENHLNGQRVISHGGDTIFFHSGLFLIPEQNVGLFITTNSVGGGTVGEAVMNAFLDHYYPEAETAVPTPPADFAERITPYLGEYSSTRSIFTTFEELFADTITVSLNDEGYLIISSGEKAHQFVEIEPGLLQDRYESDNQLIYRTDADGQKYLLHPAPYLEFMQTPWSTTLFNFLWLGGIVLFLDALIRWLIRFVKGWRKREPQPLGARLARGTAVLFGLLWLIFAIGFVVVVSDTIPVYELPRFFVENIPMMSALLILPFIMAISSIGMLILAVLTWVKGYWHRSGRLHYSLLAVAALLLVWTMSYWNLLF